MQIKQIKSPKEQTTDGTLQLPPTGARQEVPTQSSPMSHHSHPTVHHNRNVLPSLAVP